MPLTVIQQQSISKKTLFSTLSHKSVCVKVGPHESGTAYPVLKTANLHNSLESKRLSSQMPIPCMVSVGIHPLLRHASPHTAPTLAWLPSMWSGWAGGGGWGGDEDKAGGTR